MRWRLRAGPLYPEDCCWAREQVMQFPISELTVVPLQDVRPGDFYLLAGPGQHQLIKEFVVEGLQEGSRRRVRFEEFEWRSNPMPEDMSGLSCLKIWRHGELRIELPDPIINQGPMDTPGALYINAEDVRVIVTNGDANRPSGTHLRMVSLRTWKTFEFDSRGWSTFMNWKLVEARPHTEDFTLVEFLPPAQRER